MYWIFENAEKLGGFATVGMLFVAIVALAFAIVQICVTRNSQREATAKDIYRDYLKLAFENPKFANPAKFVGTAKGCWKNKDEWKQDERYRWFVAFMLNSYDEIASTNLRDETWRKVILYDFKFHKDYLSSPEFEKEEGGWSLFSTEMKDIADML
jgi:hypothetical protein